MYEAYTKATVMDPRPPRLPKMYSKGHTGKEVKFKI